MFGLVTSETLLVHIPIFWWSKCNSIKNKNVCWDWKCCLSFLILLNLDFRFLMVHGVRKICAYISFLSWLRKIPTLRSFFSLFFLFVSGSLLLIYKTIPHNKCTCSNAQPPIIEILGKRLCRFVVCQVKIGPLQFLILHLSPLATWARVSFACHKRGLKSSNKFHLYQCVSNKYCSS